MMAERLRMEEEACKSKAEEEEERRKMLLEEEKKEEKGENDVVSSRVNAQEAARLEMALKMALGVLKVQTERMKALLRLY